MIYLLETNLSENKNIKSMLTKVYGINKYYSNFFCKKLGLTSNFKVSELTIEQKTQLIRLIESSNIAINSDLQQILTLQKTKLINIKSYKGLRKLKGFPVRGQRTRSNAKTSKKFKY